MNIKLLSTCLAILVLALGGLSAQTVAVPQVIPVSVSITGDVANPGIYTLTTMNRVSEALNMAELKTAALSVPNVQDMSQKGVATGAVKPTVPKDTLRTAVIGKRSVTLVRQGQRQNLDMLRFYRMGDLTQNPYLKDGDVILVNPAQSVVTLQGGIRNPGDYEFRAGDSIRGLLDLALGVSEEADLSKAILYRYRPNLVEFDKTNLDLSGYPSGANPLLDMQLQAGDRLIIPLNAEFRKAYKVFVTGKVRMPGMYYIDNNTTLYDLLLFCGGPIQEADLNNSFIYNKIVSENFDPDFERLSRFSYAQMTWLEYSYLRTKTRQLKGKYSVSVSRCWDSQGKEHNPILRDGDEVYVPEMLNGVWVAGQVRFPGLVPWNKDRNWKDYLEAAGGFANNRKVQGTRIIRVHSGNWIKPTNKIQINPGDIIFIPDKEERYTWDDIKEAILIASQLLTIVIAIQTFK